MKKRPAGFYKLFKARKVITCDNCGNEKALPEVLLFSCGHAICWDCMPFVLLAVPGSAVQGVDLADRLPSWKPLRDMRYSKKF